VVAKGTLKNKIDRLLQSPPLIGPLRAQGIAVVDASAPKQTDTTQRWKVGLRAEGLGVPLRTRIEFSRRDAITGAAFDAVDREVLRPYGVATFLATHYATPRTILQKIHALSARAQPQPRDVFDLSMLFARLDAAELKLSEKEKRWLASAIENAMGISFDEYASKVVAFLDPGQRELYDTRATWETMQSSVVEHLESLP